RRTITNAAISNTTIALRGGGARRRRIVAAIVAASGGGVGGGRPAVAGAGLRVAVRHALAMRRIVLPGVVADRAAAFVVGGFELVGVAVDVAVPPVALPPAGERADDRDAEAEGEAAAEGVAGRRREGIRRIGPVRPRAVRHHRIVGWHVDH